MLVNSIIKYLHFIKIKFSFSQIIQFLLLCLILFVFEIKPVLCQTGYVIINNVKMYISPSSYVNINNHLKITEGTGDLTLDSCNLYISGDFTINGNFSANISNTHFTGNLPSTNITGSQSIEFYN